jgi:hypothetical protein
MQTIDVDALAHTLGLGALLGALRRAHGGYELLDHWQQGEFHHDTVVRAAGHVLVVATNCNGGVKEVLAFDDVPDRWALWHARCPDNAEIAERATRQLPPVKAQARTRHWFDPCEILVADARSELKPACRKRAPGGGWEMA